MTQRSLLKSQPLYLIAIFLLSTTLSCQHTEEKNRPNIIVFLVDDMGWQDTSVPFWEKETPLNRLYETPAMERLAREGMLFTQAYATSVCSPSRVSLMTGMNAARHRVTNWTLRANEQPVADDDILQQPDWNMNGMSRAPGDHSVWVSPLPEIMQNEGYRTIHVGKAHFGAIGTSGADPRLLGFDLNIAGHAAGAPASYYGEDAFGNNREPKPVWAVPGLEQYHGQDIYLTEALTREALASIDQSLADEKPFFLYFAHYAVHTPIHGDDRFVQKYYDKGMDSTEAKYASMIEGMDKSLGDLMDHLETKGIDENTIILFMSDNGGLSAVARGGEKHSHNLPLSSGKGSAREGGIRVPMMVKWPGRVAPNTKTDGLVIVEDFFPTIKEMAQAPEYGLVQKVDGQSFVPLLDGKSGDIERALYWHYPNRWGPTGPGIGATSSIRKGNWKLIYYHASRAFELFDLENDIGETRNLADQEPEKLLSLTLLLTSHLKAVKAQMPVDKRTGKVVEYPIEVL